MRRLQAREGLWPSRRLPLLRKLRTEARLTQEELAEAAAPSSRSVSDLERGIAATPRRDTVRLLADALNLTAPPVPPGVPAETPTDRPFPLPFP